MMLDVHHRALRDIWLEVIVALGGLVLLIAFATLLVVSQK